MQKLPNTPGIAGIMNRKIMTTPCSVNMRLYVFAPMMVGSGVSSSSRIAIAKMPPSRNITSTDTRYMTPIRLWSSVSSHDLTPRSAFR